MSNVKPGEMAKIIKPHFRHGAIGEVMHESDQQDRDMLIALEAEWALIGQIWLCRLMTGTRGVDNDTGAAAYLYPGDEAWIADVYLRPIRDPGEDTQDESHAWLPPVPTTTKERETA